MNRKTKQPQAQILMDGRSIASCISSLAEKILASDFPPERTALIGIRTRGEVIAGRLARKLKALSGSDYPVGGLDVTFNRDDLHMNLKQPAAKGTDIPFDITDRDILLVDDVLFTGRTIQAALEALKELGRPRCVRLVVFADRGHRELPIQADFTGAAVKSGKAQKVKLHLKETDGEDELVLIKP